MNWEQIQGKWQEYKGQVKQRWGKLTDQDLTVINGKRDVLVGKLHERAGATKEQAEKEIAEFVASCDAVKTAAKTATKAAAKPAAGGSCCNTQGATDKV